MRKDFEYHFEGRERGPGPRHGARARHHARRRDFGGDGPGVSGGQPDRGFFGRRSDRAFFGRGPGGGRGRGAGRPGGPGWPFGPGGPFGDDPGPRKGKRFFGRGDLKFALLELLVERPMHGYEMMKALGERSGGTYTPSAGSVYPTLQMLEDRGFVTAGDVEGKKVYTITDAGREFLGENRSGEGPRPGRRGFWGVPEDDWSDFAAVWNELRSLAPVARHAMHRVRHDPRQLPRLRRLIGLVRVELEKIAGGADEFDA